jgi:hypothetical protein
VVSFPQISPPKPFMPTPLPHTCYMLRPFNSSRFVYPKSVWWVKLLYAQINTESENDNWNYIHVSVVIK